MVPCRLLRLAATFLDHQLSQHTGDPGKSSWGGSSRLPCLPAEALPVSY